MKNVDLSTPVKDYQIEHPPPAYSGSYSVIPFPVPSERLGLDVSCSSLPPTNLSNENLGQTGPLALVQSDPSPNFFSPQIYPLQPHPIAYAVVLQTVPLPFLIRPTNCVCPFCKTQGLSLVRSSPGKLITRGSII